MLESRKQDTWNKRGGGYIGPEPKGHYLIYSWWEGDPVLGLANLDTVKERLAKAAGIEPKDLPEAPTDNGPWILRIGGRFGRFQHVFIGPDSPEHIRVAAEDILTDLQGYPILDEDRYGEYELERAQEVWEMLDLRERVKTIQEANRYGSECISIFAARHDTVPCGAIGYGCLAEL